LKYYSSRKTDIQSYFLYQIDSIDGIYQPSGSGIISTLSEIMSGRNINDLVDEELATTIFTLIAIGPGI